MKGYRIRKCSPHHTCPRVHNHSGRFVNYGEKFVLENDIERNVFRLKAGGRKLTQFDVDLVGISYLVRRFGRVFIYQHVAFVDQPLQPRTRPALDVFSKKRIKALSGILQNKSDVIGYVFAINGHVNSADVYASRALFAKLGDGSGLFHGCESSTAL